MHKYAGAGKKMDMIIVSGLVNLTAVKILNLLYTNIKKHLEICVKIVKNLFVAVTDGEVVQSLQNRNLI
jgi:hypothetical protein